MERSDALKLTLALTFGVVAFMLWFMSGMFCYGQDNPTCRIQAIGALLFNPYSVLPLIFGALILLVVVAVLLSLKPKAGSKAWEAKREREIRKLREKEEISNCQGIVPSGIHFP